MAALADLHMVETRWRPVADSELDVVADLLDYASAKLRVRVPSIDARVADGTLDPVLPAGVVTDAVVRVLKNRTTSARDLSDFDNDVPPGAAEWTSAIGFLDGEIRSLLPASAVSARSIPLTSGMSYRCTPRVRRLRGDLL